MFSWCEWGISGVVDVEIAPETVCNRHCMFCLIDENQGYNIIGGNVCYIFSLGNPIHSVTFQALSQYR